MRSVKNRADKRTRATTPAWTEGPLHSRLVSPPKAESRRPREAPRLRCAGVNGSLIFASIHAINVGNLEVIAPDMDPEKWAVDRPITCNLQRIDDPGAGRCAPSTDPSKKPSEVT